MKLFAISSPMLRLPEIALPGPVAATLQGWQEEVDGAEDFPARVGAAQRRFSQRNTRANPTFQTVRGTLRAMHGELVRCVYCEDSVADEVEHVFPKAVYPDKVFVWRNYTYACGPCNGPKNNRFAVFQHRDGKEVDVTPPHPSQRPAGWQPVPPTPGDPLLINPREEDPLDFLWLDLLDTFRFDPLDGLDDPRAVRRAEYTRDELHLNRDFLLRSRKNAFVAMRAILKDYADEQEGQQRPERFKELERTFGSFVHRTVWTEMIRQRTFSTELNDLFTRVPQALGWR